MHDNAIQLEIRSEQVKLVYKASLNATLASFVAASFLAYLQWPVINHTIILTWLACMGAMTTARIISVFAFFRAKPELTRIKSWEKISIFIMGISAVIWSAAGIFLFPEGNFERQTGTIVILAGMSAGAAATLSALRQPAMIYIAVVMLPLSAHLYTQSTSTAFSLATMCLVYTVFLLTTTEINHKTYQQNISMRIKSRKEEELIRKSEETNFKTTEILKKIAAGEPASKIYDAIALLYESRHPGLRCSMLILQANKLLHGGAPSLPEAYCQAIHGLENGPDIGSCGTSTYTGKRVIVENIETDPKWSQFKDLALHHGLRCCWSEPIKDSAGKILGAFGMYYDHPAAPTAEDLSDLEAAARLAAIVMEREERELQLRQKHKMEAVGYMAGGMAHNFNNNLSIILGNVELSQMKLPKDSKIAPLLENAKIAVLRSRDLVKQIITYSRKGSQKKAPIQLLSIVNETANLLRFTLPTTIKLETVISPDCASTFINGDSSQIQEVIVNLCNNAVQAMKEQGELKISIEPVELKAIDIPAQYEGTPGRYAKLSVQDYGCGISPQIFDKIFDPFFTTKEEFEGAGMGLATVQGIVAQHGGIIKIDSFPGSGATFSLYFPVIKQPQIAEPVSVNKDQPEGSEHILLIDDDKMLANLGKELLTSKGYQVTSMTDSTEALKLFTANANRFQLIITDQTMPNLCGKDLIHKLKEIRPNLRTILCTGYSRQIDENQAKQQGIDAFCMKPLDLPELLQTMRQVLDREEIVSANHTD